MKLRLMTYNIAHGKPMFEDGDTVELEQIANVIRRANADIVVLNEVYGRCEGSAMFPGAQAEKIAAHIGYHCFFGKSIFLWGSQPYGNAILSKYPITEAKITPIPEPVKPYESPYYEDRSVCRCVVDVFEDGKIRQIAVYASHYGLSPAEHRCAVETSTSLIMNEKLPHVFMGDLNMTPDCDIMKPLFDCMTDTAPFIEGDSFTFPASAPDRKIDYIFTSSDFSPISAKVLKTMASDHRPIVCDIEL